MAVIKAFDGKSFQPSGPLLALYYFTQRRKVLDINHPNIPF